LEFHTSSHGKEFENLLIRTANDMIQSDPRSMGRSHLDSYHINLNAILDRISNYNQKVNDLIQGFEVRTRQGINTNIPSLQLCFNVKM
jgi:hypothetical protein